MFIPPLLFSFLFPLAIYEAYLQTYNHTVIEANTKAAIESKPSQSMRIRESIALISPTIMNMPVPS
jgi:hypothetical protein